MSKDRVVDSLGRIDDDMIQSVEALRQKKKRPAWRKWGAMAACFCLLVAAMVVAPICFQGIHQPHRITTIFLFMTVLFSLIPINPRVTRIQKICEIRGRSISMRFLRCWRPTGRISKEFLPSP